MSSMPSFRTVSNEIDVSMTHRIQVQPFDISCTWCDLISCEATPCMGMSWFIYLFVGPVVQRKANSLPSLKYATLSCSVNSVSRCSALRMEQSAFAIRKVALNLFLHWGSNLFSTSLIIRSALAIFTAETSFLQTNGKNGKKPLLTIQQVRIF